MNDCNDPHVKRAAEEDLTRLIALLEARGARLAGCREGSREEAELLAVATLLAMYDGSAADEKEVMA